MIFKAIAPILEVSEISYKEFSLTIQDSTFSYVLGKDSPLIEALCNARIFITRTTFNNNEGALILASAHFETETDNPLVIELQEANVFDNFAGNDALIVGKTNTMIKVIGSNFTSKLEDLIRLQTTMHLEEVQSF